MTSGRFWPRDESLLRAVVDWSVNRIVDGQDPMTAARPPEELLDEIGDTVTAGGIGGAEALRLFTEVLVPATRAQDDPMNLAYVAAAPTEAALVFDLAVSAAEIFAGTWESGAGAIAAENQALSWIASLLGWPAAAGGCFVSGGTMGNLSALVAARSGAETPGVERAGRWMFAASPAAHSSIGSAARVMDCDILEVAGDGRGRMTGEALSAAVAGLSTDDRARLFAVVATAGTTNAGVVDDLAGVAAVCGDNDVWLHVDGAYGGAALAARSVRSLFDGIEGADSFVVDPHKWLFAPYDCCALVYREPVHAALVHSQFASYLEQLDRSEWNPADYAIHLSRRARGLPFWFSLATYGTDRYSEAVETVLAVTRGVADEVRLRPFLDLVMEPDLSVVLFERRGWSEEQYQAWSVENAVSGTVLCVPTRWEGRPVLRFCFVNPDTEVERVARVLDSLAD